MTRLSLAAACALLVAGGTAAHADCAADLQALSGETQTSGAEGGGISKDGSLAPLQEPGGGGTDTGTTAMSGSDAAAQQAGQPTAAEQASGAGQDSESIAAPQSNKSEPPMPASRQQALELARAALAQGDEDGCMRALEQARSM